MQTRYWTVALGALALALPVTRAAAQDEDRVRVRLEGLPDMVRERVNLVMNRRVRLGVKVNLQARETDSIGAYVDAVTPGGPADRAGIQSGDVITKLDGTSLLAKGRPSGADAGRSLPGLRLIELAAKLEPNDTVAVELRRGKERRTVKLVTGDEPQVLSWSGPDGQEGFVYRLGPDEGGPPRDGMRVPGPDMERMRVELDRLGDAMPRMTMLYAGPLADLELAPLNKDLGQYFGTTEGVLVISVPDDSPLGLKGGDVILGVDGRKPSSPSQLLRILRTYEGEEPVNFDVMRNRRREQVGGKMPKGGDWRRGPFRVHADSVKVEHRKP